MRTRVGASLVLLVAVVLLAAFARWRWRAQRAAVPPVPEVAGAAGKGRPVIFVGLDGGDWELLDGYVAMGAMPHLARLVREGSGGTLMTLHPPLSPLVWTTMMTGASPLAHGVLDFTRFNPADGREEPITSDERRVPAVWNMATYAGKRVAVLGLWATFPAERVNGLIVSDRLFPFLFKEGAATPGLVYPPDRLSWVREARRRAEASVGLEELRTYLPWLSSEEHASVAKTSDPYAHPAGALRRILVETRLVHDLGVEWIRRQRPDLAVVYIQGTDSIGHVFAPFAPPRQPAVPEEEYERYRQVPERFFRYVDGLLGAYRGLAESSHAVLFVASDHGFRWSKGRPPRVSSLAGATAATWHRPEGMYLLWGRGIASAPGHPHRGRVDQVAATLLALLDLPPQNGDAPLSPVSASSRAAFDYRPHYRPADVAATTGAEAEALERLRALGYLGGASGSSGSQGSTRTAGSFTSESLILRLQGKAEEAVAAAEKALALDPQQAAALWCLSDLLQGRLPDRSDELLVQAYARGLPLGLQYLLARSEKYRQSGQTPRALGLLGRAVTARPEDHEAWRARGRFRVDRGECAAGRPDLEKAAQLAPQEPASQAALGLVQLCLGDEKQAAQSLARGGASLGDAYRTLAAGALARGDLARAEQLARHAAAHPETAQGARLLQAEIALRRNRPDEALLALEAARSGGTARAEPVPNLELLRGEALARLGRAPEAEKALREEVRAFPRNSSAWHRLAVVLALQHRPRPDVRAVLEAMYEADPRRETAVLAARILDALGDAEVAGAWRRRAASPVAPAAGP